MAVKRKDNMGSEDNRMMEEALNDLRKQNDALRKQNADLKDFLQHLSNEINSFLNYNAISKPL
jgi:prefoldin subunit 5